MLSLKTKELSSARDVIRSVCREIRLSFLRAWLIHTKRLTKDACQSSGGQQYAPVIRDVCPRCESSKYKKNGYIHNSKHKHHCHNCRHQFVQCFEQALIAAG